MRTADIVLFSLVSFHWALNILLMLFWRRLRQRKVIAGALYIMIGIIIISRMIEVNALTCFNENELANITGIVATYAKIALGWCQIFAIIEIRKQMALHVRTMSMMGYSESFRGSTPRDSVLTSSNTNDAGEPQVFDYHER